MCFNKITAPTLYDNLERPLDLTTVDRSLWDDKCDYCEPKELNRLNPKNKNLTIFQLNIQSLLSKQLDLNILLNSLHQNQSLPKLYYSVKLI